MRVTGLAVVLVLSLFVTLDAEGQQPVRSPRLGVLLFGTPENDPNLPALRQGLVDLGYIESRNLTIEYRYASGRPERLRELAAELVAVKPNAILALGGDVAPFARAATSTIPIVMIVSVDPVEGGLVASMARPEET